MIIFYWLKKPIVDLTDKNFCIHLAIILNSFENANKLFKNQRIKIIFLSHIFPAPYLALISEALKFKVQVLVSYNSWGTLRLMKMKTINDYKLYAQLPSKVDWEKISTIVFL